MNFSVTTHSRDDLIHFGHFLGRGLLEVDRGKPWIITAGKPAAFDAARAGKSLVALAIEEIFDPGRYPNGIGLNLEPDLFALHEPERKAKFVFINAGWTFRAGREKFDHELADYESRVPNAKVIFISNLERVLPDAQFASAGTPFDYWEHGLASDRLDMRLIFYKISEPFDRIIETIIEDEALLSRLLSADYPQESPDGEECLRPSSFQKIFRGQSASL